MKNSLAKYIAIFGAVLLLFAGCKKSNHDTLVPLGEENYMLTIDDIYPEAYRLQWPAIDNSGYYSITSDNKLQPPLDEGVFPPNLMGEFLIEGVRTGGNEIYHTQYNEESLYNVAFVDDMNIRLTILDQSNGLAYINIVEFNSLGQNTIATDDVYLFGDGKSGKFTLCFNGTLPMSNVLTEYYAIIISGVFNYKIENSDGHSDTIYGMSDVRYWHLVKDKSGMSPIYVNIGGQRSYKDVDNFAERVKTIEELKNE